MTHLGLELLQYANILPAGNAVGPRRAVHARAEVEAGHHLTCGVDVKDTVPGRQHVPGTDETPRALQRPVTDTGTSHLLEISCLHVMASCMHQNLKGNVRGQEWATQSP